MVALLAIALLAAPVQIALADQPQPEDFELLPPEKKADPQAQKKLEHELEVRRKMLQLHQLGGFLTLASVSTTTILGQLNYADKYGGGGDSGRYYEWHKWAGFTTAFIFAATATLSVFAPSPLEKRIRFDTATVHKVSMAVAAAGMLAQIVLGPIIASKEGEISQRDWALAHQIVGYTTLVATTTGAVVLTF
ncbi:MAG: hypothetical protein ABR567_10450 [Myxococcales bacterium]|nr:hypothetical protein [Myxococcales bacterium]